MRLLTIRGAAGDRCGLLAGDTVIDVNAALPNGEGGLRGFLERPDWVQRARELSDSPPLEHALGSVEDLPLGPVVPDPRKVIVVGANTHSHLREAGMYTGGKPPRRPMVLAKSPQAVAGPYDPIVYPPETEKLDYEAELCAVIGRRAKRVDEANAMSVVAGFTVANDVSARDYQLSEWEDNTFYRTHYLGKSFDTFCPCGPVLVTPDELGPLASVEISCWVNNELRQKSTLDDLFFSVEQVVSFVSDVMTLEPGDLILMGSPAGVGAFWNPPSGYLSVGDVVKCAVGGIGAIENRVVSEGEA